MKLLLDEMLSPIVAEQLRRRGHDVGAVAERTDLRTRPDTLIFTTAQAEERAVVTANIADFQQLASVAGDEHAGLVLVPSSMPQGGNVIGRLVAALDTLLGSEVDLRGSEHWLV